MKNFFLGFILVFLFAGEGEAFLQPHTNFISNSSSDFFDITGGSLPSGMTVTNSNGSYINSSGNMVFPSANTARIDYDPVTLAINGLLIEEPRINAFLGSQDVGGTGWTNTSFTHLAGQTTGPDGTLSGSKMISTATSNVSTNQGFTLAAGSTYQWSVYVKYGNAAWMRWRVFETGPGNSQRYFNVQTCTVGGNASSARFVGGVATNAGNGWCRITASYVPAGANASAIILDAANGDGNGASTVGNFYYLYGGQSEIGGFPTSLIPTTTVAVTRTADVVTKPLRGFNTTTGTIVVEAKVASLNTTANQVLVDINDGTVNNRIFSFLNINAKPSGGITVAGTEKDSGAGLTAITANTVFRTAVGFQSAKNVTSTNGAADSAGTFGASTLPSGLTTVQFGNRFDNTKALNGWLRKGRYWNYNIGAAQSNGYTTLTFPGL